MNHINSFNHVKFDKNEQSTPSLLEDGFKDLLPNILQYCDSQDRTNIARGCKATKKLIEDSTNYPEIFKKKFGASTSGETAANNFKERGALIHQRLQSAQSGQTIGEIQELKKKELNTYKIPTYDRIQKEKNFFKRSFKKLSFYTLFDLTASQKTALRITKSHIEMGRSFIKEPSKDLIEMHQKHKRLKVFDLESTGMKREISKAFEERAARIQKLPAALRIPFQFVSFFIHLGSVQMFHNRLLAKIDRAKKEFDQMIKQNTSQEIEIGETSIKIGQNDVPITVTIQPRSFEYENSLHFPGSHLVRFKRNDTKEGVGVFIIRHAWENPSSIHNLFYEDVMENPKGKLTNHGLYVEQVSSSDNKDANHFNEDLPIIRLMTQVMVELMANDPDTERLLIDSAYHHGFVYASAGLNKKPLDKKNFKKTFVQYHALGARSIKKEIENAHSQGYRYPAIRDLSSFNMEMRKEKSVDPIENTRFTAWDEQQKGSVYTPTKIWWDADGTKTTWEDHLSKNRVLKSTGPAIPKFWNKEELSKFES